MSSAQLPLVAFRRLRKAESGDCSALGSVSTRDIAPHSQPMVSIVLSRSSVLYTARSTLGHFSQLDRLLFSCYIANYLRHTMTDKPLAESCKADTFHDEVETHSTTGDHTRLEELGFEEELERKFSVWSLAALVLCLMGTWEAVGSTMAQALLGGGAPCLVYN